MNEINVREKLNFPPFCDIALIALSSSLEKELQRVSALLSEQIAELSKGANIPDYWKTELESKADAIQVAMEAAGRNKSAFLGYRGYLFVIRG